MLLSLEEDVLGAYLGSVRSTKHKAGTTSLAGQVQARVRLLRAARGLTQEELCERAGISVDAVTRIESGRRTPTLATVERLALALGVPPSDLLDPRVEPRQRNPGQVDRIVALLDGEPPEVQRAIEKIVKVVVALAR